MTAINVDAANPNYSSDNGVLLNKAKTTLIQCPAGKSGTYVIPNSVTSIGDGAFCYCAGLTSVTIPSSVTSIGNTTFFSCSGLTSVACLNPNPATITLGTTVFSGVPTTTCVLRVPIGSYSAYHTAPQWSDFTNIVDGYTITATAGTGGTISPSGVIAVNYADSQTFTFSANSGYEISQVLIDNLNNFPAVAAGNYTFPNVMANHKIEVYFSPSTGIVGAGHALPLPKIYPNPTNGQLRISGDIFDGKDIQIYDIVGQVVFTSHLANLSPETTIDISHLANGLYFLKVGGKMVKIVKE